jgi:hypothetical protein
MLVRLHSQATITPKIRAAIQASADQAWIVGERYGISEQTVLQSKTPLQAMKDWQKLRPELFKKNPYYLTGCDI